MEHTLLPTHLGWHASTESLCTMLNFKCPLIHRIIYNSLSYWKLHGPIGHMDIFLSPAHVRIILIWIWKALQKAHENRLNLNWAASVPYAFVNVLANVFQLSMDAFSDAFNNNFHSFVIDPQSPFAFMSVFVDFFTVMDTYNGKLSALCNPPFAPRLIVRAVEAIKLRCIKQLATNIVYVGPGLQACGAQTSNKSTHYQLIKLAVIPPGSLPFVHALNGVLPGFPKELEVWWLGNTWHQIDGGLDPTRCVVRALNKINRRYPLQVAPELYAMAPCRVQRRLSQQVYWQALEKLQQPYKALLNQPGRLNWTDLLPLYLHVRQAAKFLPIYDQLRIKFPHMDWDYDILAPGSCVYIIVCTVCSHVYVGSTVQTPWRRLQQELSAARRTRHFCHPRTWRRRMNLSEHMIQHGMENSIAIILEARPGVLVNWVRSREWQIMRMFSRGKLLNTNVPHTGRVTMSPKTLSICRQGIHYILADQHFDPLKRTVANLGIKDTVNKVISSNHVSFDARTLLQLHQHLSEYFYHDSGTIKHFRHCMLTRLRHMGMRLPSKLMVRCLQLTGQERTNLRALLRRFIHSVALHPLVANYYMSCVTIVRTQSKPLGICLHNFKRILRNLTEKQLQEVVQCEPSNCGCARLGNELPRHRGHVLFRPIDLPLHTLTVGGHPFTTMMIGALQQNMMGVPRLSTPERWPDLRRSLIRFRRQIHQSRLAAVQLLPEALGVLTKAAVVAEGQQIVATAVQAMKLLRPCICGPLDKNPSALWICCPHLYLQLLYEGYLAGAGLGGFEHFKHISEAPRALLASLREYGLLHLCPRTVQKSLGALEVTHIPNLYLLLKNKSFPLHAQGVKTRPITSHHRHPFKLMAARHTRGLTILLQFATRILCPSYSMLCQDLISSQRYWDVAMQRFHDTPTQHLLLFEYDLDSMYYHLDQQACITALQDFFLLFKDLFKRRTVAISKQDRSLDRIGSGSRELYTNILITDLLTFCEFELRGNSVARVGSMAYRQTIGIPMGGFPSAPLANICLLMRELRCNAMGLSRDFFYFRYLDNLPGILDQRFTTLDDVCALFLRIYKMPMKLEQSGCTIDTLEMRISLVGGTLSYSSKPLLWDQAGNSIDGTIRRIPPIWCEKRSIFLNYYLPSAFLKCVRYSSNYLSFLLGTENLVLGLLAHGFTLASLLAILRRIFYMRHFPPALFQYLSHILYVRSDRLPG